jgi:hypothetical protein
VFDPRAVSDRSTFDQPTLLSQGIDDVMVNGILVRENGLATGKQAGEKLHRTEHMPTRPQARGQRKISASFLLPGAAGAKRASTLVDLSIAQAASSHHATGHFRLVENHRRLLEMVTLGDLQIDTGWASFTGIARLANGAEEPVVVILDQNDPLQPGKSMISVEGIRFRFESYHPGRILDLDRQDETSSVSTPG